jgi:hypothetical protein
MPSTAPVAIAREEVSCVASDRPLLIAAPAERDFACLSPAAKTRLLQFLREPLRCDRRKFMKGSNHGRRRGRYVVHRYRIADHRLLVLSRDGADYLWHIGDRREIYDHFEKRFDTRIPFTAITIEEFQMKNAAKQPATSNGSLRETHPIVEEIRRLVGDYSRSELDATKAQPTAETSRLDGEILRQWERLEALSARDEAIVADTTRIATTTQGLKAATDCLARQLAAVITGIGELGDRITNLDGRLASLSHPINARIDGLAAACDADRKATHTGFAEIGRTIERLTGSVSDLRSHDLDHATTLRLMNDEMDSVTTVVDELAVSIATLRHDVEDLRGLCTRRPVLDRFRTLLGRLHTIFAGSPCEADAA